MNLQSPGFAEMASQFLATLNPVQAAALHDLLSRLHKAAQQHLASLSISTSAAYELLDQITQARA